MKKFLFVASILFATLSLTFTTQAQTGPNGTWRAEGVGNPFPWTLVLRVDGPRQTGTVSSCSSNRGVIEVYQGKVDGDTITFKCNSLDQGRTLTFTGRISGDEITFTWEKQVREGAGPGTRDDALFGPSAAPRFTVKRVMEAELLDSEREQAAKTSLPRTVTFDQILHADREPQNWLTYSGTVLGLRYSPLTQITPGNRDRQGAMDLHVYA